jgi:serine protease Do
LRTVNFTTPGRLKNGKIVIGIGTESQSLGIGITTAPPSEKSMEKDCETCIDMGMTLSSMMTLTRVYPRTVGERLGLLVGDRLLTINRKQVSSRAQFDRIEKEIQAGDLISITFARNGQAFEVADKVPDLTKISKRDRWGGGPFSKRRSGFDDVLVHDSVIDPLDCGGPLVNLQGQFCGINIARSMRVASLAIPAESVLKFLQRYLDSSDLAIER